MAARTTRTISVERPLQATSRQRTRRMSLASSASTPSSSTLASAGPASPSGIGHPIPDTTHGLDPTAGIAELRAQVVDVRVHGIRGNCDAERPGLIEELVSAQALARMTEQALEEGELPRAELDGLAVNGHPAGPLV